ncbi:MAG TPA: hypothetical protein DC040_10885, partial [Deltaproteobacteria bacterium]|nr:hypothetical protein [Deltaproteobacteria bacterium]
MLNQTSVTEITSEEILQQMIRETFEVPKIEKPASDENFPGAGFSQQIERYSESKENLLVQRLVNTLTAQLQTILPGAFRITSETEQCLSYANLSSWSPGRSYFSLFEMKHSNSVWILHFSRTVGEGLASLVHTKNSRNHANIFNDLREADSITYLEIGEMLRKFFVSLLELWPKSDKLKVASCRHILQLGFLRDSVMDE